ncbi:DUF475 domain-containing protein [Streptomyces sp. MnatMP-M17]|uniref:DUF475 domain-containing protein n=1 Tax=unclassified Streptomyces TaxID=2593676 RepID=UPI00081E52BF|nr:DUF475 domain-containing protein [Streptomyces sp. MnatMP-M17]MYZ34025.1 DUF475 domain-containing protein [Streptomyces sp. SID4917]SCF63558.1 hypothetical protein GA0115259_100425 [Streptomyces sp. MnatMP-M17]
MVLKTFRWAFLVTAAGLAAGALYGGWAALGIVAILAVLEVSLSFDNAVINAGILKRMSAFWQTIFLTVGVLIAVFGMRLVFPVLIVAITAKIGPVQAVTLAINDKDRYQQLVTDAHPAIAAFGGIFLLMIFLNFIFEEREITWQTWLERPLARLGKVETLSVCIALIVLVVAATTVATHAHQHGGGHADKAQTVLTAGVAGLITYLVVAGLSGFFENRIEEVEEEAEEAEEKAREKARERHGGGNGAVAALTGKAAFFTFLYLEVIDASFSFDGVIGAFAITNDIVLMALGLGIGAMYVRSLTVYLVRQGTLDDFVFLEHGAHYAIGALAVILLVTIQYQISELVTGLVGVVLIGWSFWSSVRRNARIARETERERAVDGTG